MNDTEKLRLMQRIADLENAILYFKLHEHDEHRGQALRRLWAVLDGNTIVSKDNTE